MNETTTGQPNRALLLATVLIGEPIEEWVSRRRSKGQPWDRMARDLADKTNNQCVLSRELLRRHFGHIPRGENAVDDDAAD